jgi:hypothetical protein
VSAKCAKCCAQVCFGRFKIGLLLRLLIGLWVASVGELVGASVGDLAGNLVGARNGCTLSLALSQAAHNLDGEAQSNPTPVLAKHAWLASSRGLQSYRES